MKILVIVKYVKVLTAAKIHDERAREVFMPYKGSMNSRTGCMINTKVTKLFVSTKEVTFFFIYHKFLKRQK